MSTIDFDRAHLWHPYSNVIAPGPTHVVAEAEGAWLTLADGTRMIDAMSSWWCMIHGHRHPEITKAMHAQIDRLPHVMFGGLTHDPAADLGRKLIEILPEGLDKIFYCDSGSVSVEVALKMAAQYQMARGHTARHRYATIRGGYHGDTFKTMGVCDPQTGMHHLFGSALSLEHFAPRPPIAMGANWPQDPHENGTAALRDMLETHQDHIAALVLEPVVQGAGGMYFYHPNYLREARALCDRYDILLILDEIATGFGRTGKIFAMDHAGITPDILCLGKGLSGGHISFAATIATDEIAQTIGNSALGVFMHGPTFMGNPLACAAANASLGILQTGAWKHDVARIERALHRVLGPARDMPNVADVRVLGAIGVIEMRHSVSADQAHAQSRAHGVYLRPFARNIYTMPPYCLTDDNIAQVGRAMCDLARSL